MTASRPKTPDPAKPEVAITYWLVAQLVELSEFYEE